MTQIAVDADMCLSSMRVNQDWLGQISDELVTGSEMDFVVPPVVDRASAGRP
jgi:hypothetical protein